METSQLTIYADWAAIIGVPISIIGLIIAFFSLHAQSNRIKNCEQNISTISDVIQCYSEGAQYHSCIFNFNYDSKASTPKQISEKFAQGTNEENDNE